MDVPDIPILGAEWDDVYTESQPVGDELAVDFGTGIGLWYYDGTSWHGLTSSDPDNTGNTMVDVDLD